MKYFLSFTVFCFLNLSLFAQDLIDGTYDFQTDSAKKYTLFIPSSYDGNQPQEVMLALHPLNTNRWDARSWCDTLSTFAEANQLLLVCPDGGPDGAIDDPIDTAFTSFLLDQVEKDYNVNADEVYAIGFSWGGKTVYTYGLTHADRFEGFLVVGAAVVLSEVSPIAEFAQNKKFYIVHGSTDNPSTRFTPIVQLLEPKHCVETNLLQGVGHTIDFPNRNQILTEAYDYLKTESCNAVSSSKNIQGEKKYLQQSVYNSRSYLSWSDDLLVSDLVIRNSSGQLIYQGLSEDVQVPSAAGWYILTDKTGHTERFIVVD